MILIIVRKFYLINIFNVKLLCCKDWIYNKIDGKFIDEWYLILFDKVNVIWCSICFYFSVNKI